jgi:hypothetical protein|tara:strand:- start:140 stop:307 length:168 start_codon:yes stop_codon:yes gene_type:complete
MIQKIFITIILIGVFLFFMRILNKITLKKKQSEINEESIVDLEKDPETDEYKPKE